jgi:toxin HigB-1
MALFSPKTGMIDGFKHKGLKLLFEEDNPRGVHPEHVRKLKQILSVLNAADTIEGVNLPTLSLHPLKGAMKGLWAVTVRANWRVVFRFEKRKSFGGGLNRLSLRKLGDAFSVGVE